MKAQWWLRVQTMTIQNGSFCRLTCISYDSGNKWQLFPYTVQPFSLDNGAGVCLLWSGKLICKCCLEYEHPSFAACTKQSDSLTLPSFFLVAFASDINLPEKKNERVLPGKLHNLKFSVIRPARNTVALTYVFPRVNSLNNVISCGTLNYENV